MSLVLMRCMCTDPCGPGERCFPVTCATGDKARTARGPRSVIPLRAFPQPILRERRSLCPSLRWLGRRQRGEARRRGQPPDHEVERYQGHDYEQKLVRHIRIPPPVVVVRRTMQPTTAFRTAGLGARIAAAAPPALHVKMGPALGTISTLGAVYLATFRTLNPGDRDRACL